MRQGQQIKYNSLFSRNLNQVKVVLLVFLLQVVFFFVRMTLPIKNGQSETLFSETKCCPISSINILVVILNYLVLGQHGHSGFQHSYCIYVQ